MPPLQGPALQLSPCRALPCTELLPPSPAVWSDGKQFWGLTPQLLSWERGLKYLVGFGKAGTWGELRVNQHLLDRGEPGREEAQPSGCRGGAAQKLDGEPQPEQAGSPLKTGEGRRALRSAEGAEPREGHKGRGRWL